MIHKLNWYMSLSGSVKESDRSTIRPTESRTKETKSRAVRKGCDAEGNFDVEQRQR